jgi:polar amino acid transport system permease protein
MEVFLSLIREIVSGLGTTLWLFAVTLVVSIPLGFLGSQISLSKKTGARRAYNTYVYVMRGTPLILQVLFLYFGVGLLINMVNTNLGLQIRYPRELSALISFILNYTAYFSEIFRGGIQSINRGQYEAASVLGLPKSVTMRRIVVPQVFKIVMPSLGNEVINLVKDTALVSIIAIADITKNANSAAMRVGNIAPFAVAMLFYLAITAAVTLALKKIENKMDYYKF